MRVRVFGYIRTERPTGISGVPLIRRGATCGVPDGEAVAWTHGGETARRWHGAEPGP